MEEVEKELWKKAEDDFLIECLELACFCTDHFKKGCSVPVNQTHLRHLIKEASGNRFSPEAVAAVVLQLVCSNIGKSSQFLFHPEKHLFKIEPSVELSKELRWNFIRLAWSDMYGAGPWNWYNLLHPAIKKDFFRFSFPLLWSSFFHDWEQLGSVWKPGDNPEFWWPSISWHNKAHVAKFVPELAELFGKAFNTWQDLQESSCMASFKASGNWLGEFPLKEERVNLFYHFAEKELELGLVTYLTLGCGLQIGTAVLVARMLPPKHHLFSRMPPVNFSRIALLAQK